MSKPTPLLTIFKVSTPMCFAYLLLVLEVHTDLWATHLRWKAQSRVGFQAGLDMFYMPIASL